MVDPVPLPNPHERRAQALAEITAMQEDLVAAHKTVEEERRAHQNVVRDLQYQINHWQDRCALSEDERGKYRAQAMLYQRKLVELATQMADIGLLTQRAQKVMDTVHCLLGGEDPQHAQDEQDSARALVNSLPQAPMSVQDQVVADLETMLVATKGEHVATDSAAADGTAPA